MPNHHDSGRPAPEGDSDNTAARRITELEFHLAHQQRMCEQLNEVATEQSRRLDRMERTVVRLERQLKELRDQPRQTHEASDPLDERPPHY